MRYACSHGHEILAVGTDEQPIDLTGYLCLVCIGSVVGHGSIIDPRILAPIQEVREVQAGTLEVGNDGRNVVINHPDLKPDKNGAGHIVFSTQQARRFTSLILENVEDLERQRGVCHHRNTHTEGSLGEFCNDCGSPV